MTFTTIRISILPSRNSKNAFQYRSDFFEAFNQPYRIFLFFLTFVSKAGIIVWVLFHTPTPLFIHSEIQNKPIIDNVTCHLRYP